MKKILGIAGLFLAICVFTALLSDSFLGAFNLLNNLKWIGLYGIISIGVAFVIITGGIDLSIGSLLALLGCLLAMFVEDGVGLSLGLVLVVSVAVGLFHGYSVTMLRLQPFVVTLCGLLFYRGIARRITGDTTQGFGTDYGGFKFLANGRPFFTATVAMAAGLIAAVWCAIRLRRSGADDNGQSTRPLLLFGCIGGAGLALVASVHLWKGVHFESNAIKAPQAMLDMSAGLIRQLGLAILLPAGVWLLLTAVRRDDAADAATVGAVTLPAALWCVWAAVHGQVKPALLAGLTDQAAATVSVTLGALFFAGVMFAAWRGRAVWPAFAAIAGAAIWVLPQPVLALATESKQTADALWYIGSGLCFVGLGAAGFVRRDALHGESSTWPLVILAAGGLLWLTTIRWLGHFNMHWMTRAEYEIATRGGVTTLRIQTFCWWTGLLVFAIGAGWLMTRLWQTKRQHIAAPAVMAATGLVIWLMLATLAPVQTPMPFIILILLAIVAGVFLNKTIYGRYLLALGRNEQAALYSGIKTGHMIVLAYVICSVVAGLGAVLFALEINSIQPASFASFYELYAIAGAVLGGCSLRGGEGSITGVVIGAALLVLLRNMINMLGIPTELEFAIIGAVIFVGVMVDELVKRYAARRRAAREAELAMLESGGPGS